MKKFNKNLLLTVVSMALGLSAPFSAFATVAVAPNLQTAASFSVFSALSLSAAGTGATVSADLGINPGLSASGPWTVGGSSYFGTGGLSGTAKTDATAAYTSMNLVNQPGAVTIDLDVPNPPVAPGLYIDASNATLATTLTLNGNSTDVWIFQIVNDLTLTNAATVTLTGGASACNVYWYIDRDATINGNVGKQFVGTLIANRDVVLNGATIIGRMMSLTGDLSTTGGATTISGCATGTIRPSTGGNAPIPPEPPTLTVFKHVINDNGGTAVASDSSIAVKIYGQNVAGSPAFGQENGRIYQLTQTGTTTVSELPMAGYSATFSGDCDSNGQVRMEFGDKKTCKITNNDIALVPPLINVTKVPTPLALPGGAGSVTYDYLVTNLGTVGMLNVKVTDDKCANVNYVSGDLNNNSRLGISEIWRYTCTTNLSQTTTNTVTATGQANGFTATDVAQATVVVGLPLVPPLIHVVKWPSTFLLSAGGGPVTYYYFVTNPGTEPLSNVTITDDKCTGLPARVVGHPGDLNKNNLLDSNETFNFTCQTNLTQTTTNIGTATGQANGFTAVDLSPATVVVASPKLPNTGFSPDEGGISWSISMLAGILLASTIFYFVRRKQTN